MYPYIPLPRNVLERSEAGVGQVLAVGSPCSTIILLGTPAALSVFLVFFF